MKKIQAILVAGALALTLAACTTSGGDTGNAGGTSAGYTVEVAELDPTVYPDNYPLIDADKFETAFYTLADASMEGQLDTYQDVADIFGVDGAYYTNNDFEDNGNVYKYYAWYGDDGTSILVTFKADGKKLEYFAYTSYGI